MAVEPVRILSANWEVPGSHTLAVARTRGTYSRLAKAFAMKPDEITAVVKDSGLRGRGGAGFPTGMKWSFVPPKDKRNGKPVYLLCNADESEPGTFKDRYCMWMDPHLLIEGMILASYALDCHRAYIYIRGEFRFIFRRLEEAVKEAYAAGLLGKNIQGSGFDLDLHVHLGAGAYICGEETALISSLEGEKGQPKLKPPFPAVEGAWKAPTVVNNVETLAAVPWILENGAAAYKALGTEKAPGTKLFSISGHVNKPGVVEISMGMPMKRFLDEVCGGVRGGKKLKAIIPGGSSVPIMTAEEVLEGLVVTAPKATDAGPVTQVKVARWLMEPGAAVKQGEPILACEDGLVITAPATGVLSDTRVAVGSSVPAGQALTRVAPTMDYESINQVAGSYLGSGGFIVMDEDTDLVDALTNLLRFYAHESCGQCTPCREGCGWMYQILCRVRDRKATEQDLTTLLDLADNIFGKTICFFGPSAAMPVQSFLKKFRGEFVARVQKPDAPVPVTAITGAA
jgi:NADH-quinone oxidoreductase subunit F